MKDAAAFWDGIAAKYAQDPIKDEAGYAYTLDRTRAYLNADHHVLEVGCGTGSTALLLCDAVASWTGTDISSAMIEIARSKQADALNLRFEAADIANAPTGPFDMVTAFNVLHLVPDLPDALAHIRKRLRPGGLFVSKTFCLPDGLSVMGIGLKVLLPMMQVFGKAPAVNIPREAVLVSAITSAGFDIIENARAASKDKRHTIVARKSD